MNNKGTKENAPILYSVGLMTDTIRNRKLPCATIVERGTLDLDYIASEMAHSTTLTTTDIVAVLRGFIEFGMCHLASGYRINLGDFGQFFPTLKSHCVNSFDECDESTIEQVNCRFRPSPMLKEMMQKATFERTLPATERRKTIKDVDTEIEEELGG